MRAEEIMSCFLRLIGVALIVQPLYVVSIPSSTVHVAKSLPLNSPSTSELSASPLTTQREDNSSWLSTSSWPEGSLSVEKRGSDFHYGAGVYNIKAEFKRFGRPCIYRGQKIAFKHVIDTWIRRWPRNPPTDPDAFPRSEPALDDVLQVQFKMPSALWKRHGHQMWLLAEEVITWIQHEYSVRECISSTVSVWILFHDGIFRPFGTLSLDVKEPPAFDHHDVWRLPPGHDLILPIEGENQPTSHLTFLDRNRARATWPDPVARSQLDFWTDPDPVRRRSVVQLLQRVVATIERRPVLDAQGTIDLSKYLLNSPIMKFWVEIAQRTQQSQVPWTKDLAIHVFRTLANLVNRHGIISCVIDVVKEGHFVGQVWLGANSADGQ